MTIKNGEVASADEVMNAMGSLFNDTAQNIFNADYIGIDSRLAGGAGQQLKNVYYDTFQSDSMDITGNIEYDATNDLYWGPSDWTEADYIEYDDCNDSSVDGGKWTTVINPGSESANVTENGTSQTVLSDANGTSSPDPNCSSSSNSLDFSTYNSLMVDIISITSAAGPSSGASTYIQFGGVTVLNASVGAQSSNNKSNLKLWIIKIDSTYYYRVYDTTWGSWTQFSPTGTILRFYTNANSTSGGFADSVITFNNVRFNTLVTSLSSTTDYITSAGDTSASTITNSITVVNSIGDGILIETAADGSTFESVINTEIHRPIATGTNSKTRILNQGANIITEYATKNNLY